MFIRSFRSVVILAALMGVWGNLLQCRKSDHVQKETDPVSVARLTLARGEVTILEGNYTHPARAGQIILAGQTLRTGPGSMAELFVKDQGIVRVNENAQFGVKRLDASGAEFEQGKGSTAVFLLKLKQNTDFRISTPTSVAAVRGTSFIVDVKDKKSVNFALFDGAIELTDHKGKRMVLDEKGEVSLTDVSEISREAIRPLSEESLTKLRRLAVFQKTQIEEYNSFIEELKSTEIVRSLSGESNLKEEISELGRRPSDQDNTRKANSAEENLIKRNTKKDPLKIQPLKSF